MRPRDRKILDDFTVNPSRSILVILAIAVGLFALGVIATLYLCIPLDMRSGYEQTNPANIYFRLSAFDTTLLNRVKKWESVADVTGSSIADLRAYDQDGLLHAMTVQAVSDPSWPINRLTLLEGNWPLEKGEVALENYKFDQFGLKIGDQIVFKTASGAEVPLVIRARVRDQSIGAAEYNNVFMMPANAYVSRSTLRSLEMPETWNLLRIVVSGDGNDIARIETIATGTSKKLEKAGFTIYSMAVSGKSSHPTADYVDAIAIILLLIGVLVLFLSGTLTYNTVSAILSSQTSQIGTMKTIGATYSQLVRMYTLLIFYYSLIALGIAIPTSMLAAKICREFLSAKINFAIVREGIVWEAVLMQVVLGLVVPQIAGFIPVSRGASVSIRSALSGMNTGTDDNWAPSAWINWMTRVFSRPTVLSLRNTFRKRLRLFLTLFTLSLGGAIFIGTFNVNKAIDQHIQSIGKYFQADLYVTTSVPYRFDRMQNSLLAIDGVAAVEGWGTGSASLQPADGSEGPSITLIAVPERSGLMAPTIEEGRWLNANEQNAIVLSERFHYSYPDLKVGDWITLDINQTGKKTDWEVVGFFTMAGKSGGFMAYLPFSVWTKVSGTANRVTRFEVVTDRRMTDDESKRYADALEARLEQMGYSVKTVQPNDFFVSDAAAGLNVLTAFMLIMALLVALVGSIGVTGTMSLNVMERMNEIGILRAIGASNQAVMRNVLVEGLLIGLMSYLLGSLLSVPIGRLLTGAIGSAIFGNVLGWGFDWKGYALWFAISLVFSVLASLVPARNAVRLTIREILSAE